MDFLFQKASCDGHMQPVSIYYLVLVDGVKKGANGGQVVSLRTDVHIFWGNWDSA